MDELCWELTDKVLAPALQDLPPDEDTKILLNPSGRFVLGGPEADTGDVYKRQEPGNFTLENNSIPMTATEDVILGSIAITCLLYTSRCV